MHGGGGYDSTELLLINFLILFLLHHGPGIPDCVRNRNRQVVPRPEA